MTLPLANATTDAPPGQPNHYKFVTDGPIPFDRRKRRRHLQSVTRVVLRRFIEDWNSDQRALALDRLRGSLDVLTRRTGSRWATVLEQAAAYDQFAEPRR